VELCVTKKVEDSLQDECAKDFNAQYLITRNMKDYENSKVEAILPDKFLEIHKETYT
jgi:hypothetical protein